MPTPVKLVLEAEEARAEVGRLYHEGLSDKEIAEKMGRSLVNVQKHRLLLGLKRGNPTHLSNSTSERIAALAEEGWPPNEIIAELGVSYDTVRRHSDPKLAHENGRAWNAVARWAATNHRKLWDEVRPDIAYMKV